MSLFRDPTMLTGLSHPDSHSKLPCPVSSSSLVLSWLCCSRELFISLPICLLKSLVGLSPSVPSVMAVVFISQSLSSAGVCNSLLDFCVQAGARYCVNQGLASRWVTPSTLAFDSSKQRTHCWRHSMHRNTGTCTPYTDNYSVMILLNLYNTNTWRAMLTFC